VHVGRNGDISVQFLWLYHGLQCRSSPDSQRRSSKCCNSNCFVAAWLGGKSPMLGGLPVVGTDFRLKSHSACTHRTTISLSLLLSLSHRRAPQQLCAGMLFSFRGPAHPLVLCETSHALPSPHLPPFPSPRRGFTPKFCIELHHAAQPPPHHGCAIALN
jgi:hypothetical protein